MSELEYWVRELGQGISQVVGERGFILMVFPAEEVGQTICVANMAHAEVFEAIKEWMGETGEQRRSG